MAHIKVPWLMYVRESFIFNMNCVRYDSLKFSVTVFTISCRVFVCITLKLETVANRWWFFYMGSPIFGTRGVIRFQSFLKIIGESISCLFNLFASIYNDVFIYKIYRTVAVDMRGFGFSEKPIGKKNYVMPNLIKDVKALVEYLSEWSIRKIFDTRRHLWMTSYARGCSKTKRNWTGCEGVSEITQNIGRYLWMAPYR